MAINSIKLFFYQTTFYCALLGSTTNILTMEPVIVVQPRTEDLLARYSKPKSVCTSSTANPSYNLFIKRFQEKTFLQAAKNNDVIELVQFCDLGVNVNTIGPDRDTALHWAAHHGNIRMGKFLLDKGANVNARTTKGITPLHDAVVSLLENKNGQTQVNFIEMLLSHGADVTIKDNIDYLCPDNGLTIQETIISPPGEIDTQEYKMNNKQKIVHINHTHALLLCNRLHAIDKSPTDFLIAATDNLEIYLSHLIKRGVNINARYKNNHNNTALHFAAHNQHANIVKILLENGAWPNAQNNIDATPLHCTLFHNNIPCTKLLLKYRADQTIKDNDGKTSSCLLYENNKNNVARNPQRQQFLKLIVILFCDRLEKLLS